MANKYKNKEIARKAIALGAALGVVAGIGTSVTNGEEAQAKGRSASQSTKAQETSSTTTKRPSSNATTQRDEIQTRTENEVTNVENTESTETNVENTKTENSQSDNSSGRPPRRQSSGRGNNSSGRRKAQTKVLNSTSNENTSENKTETNGSKRPQKSFKSVEDKKEKSRSDARRGRVSSTEKNENKIIIRISTK